MNVLVPVKFTLHFWGRAFLLEYDFGHRGIACFRRPREQKRLCILHAQPQSIHLLELRRCLLKQPFGPSRFRGLGRDRNSDLKSYWRRRKRGGNHGIPRGDARSRSRPKGTAFALSTSKSGGLCPYSSLFPVSGHRPGYLTSTTNRCICSTKELYHRTVPVTAM